MSLPKLYSSHPIPGLILTLSNEINGDLNWFIRSGTSFYIQSRMNSLPDTGTSLETNMNRVERLEHYIHTPPEGDLHSTSNPTPHNWPSQGQIVFENIWMKYREDLSPVLKVSLALTLHIAY